jgi:hypothetical protein
VSKTDVLALAIADVHISAKPPPARSREVSWPSAMLRPLNQVRMLMQRYDAPLIYAGDLFDAPCPSISLLNWAIEHLPPGFAVPGNHDLPGHSLAEMSRSAYWTLCLHGKIRNLEPGRPVAVVPQNRDKYDTLTLHGFPCGVPLEPLAQPLKEFNLHVAVVHQYVWSRGLGYPGADEKNLVGKVIRGMGYEAYVFGDNHTTVLKGRAANAGSLMRRRVDQKHHRPCVVLIHSDGSLSVEYLDCSEDIFDEDAKEPER